MWVFIIVIDKSKVSVPDEYHPLLLVSASGYSKLVPQLQACSKQVSRNFVQQRCSIPIWLLRYLLRFCKLEFIKFCVRPQYPYHCKCFPANPHKQSWWFWHLLWNTYLFQNHLFQYHVCGSFLQFWLQVGSILFTIFLSFWRFLDLKDYFLS